MTQCAGTTQKGERCKREAREGSEYCSIHFGRQAQPKEEAPSRSDSGGRRETAWTSDDTVRALIGIGLIIAIVAFRLRR